MENNIFMADRKPISFEEYLQYDEKSRDNLGEELPVLVYRMLEYSLKEELCRRYGKEAQVDIFRKAGRMAGEYFAKHMLNLNQPLDEFVSELQKKLQELKIGVLRIENVDEESGKIILTVAEDADCSGLPVLGETVCNYDEGFISGILTVYSGKLYTAVEVDCWATGDRVCRFHANVEKGHPYAKGFSFGLVEIPEEHGTVSINEVLHQADLIMYEQKREHQNYNEKFLDLK